MEPFNVHRGIAAPLRRSNVDTDQIIPVRFLTRSSKTGFSDALFHDWREDPDFVLNDDAYEGSTILVAGEDFGTGSSREHAVWALKNYGFRVIIAPRFGDIFRGNALTNGLLVFTLPASVIEELWDRIEAQPRAGITVDLAALEVRTATAVFPFELEEHTRNSLMEGLDHIDLSLRHAEQIAAFEARRRPALPSTRTMKV